MLSSLALGGQLNVNLSDEVDRLLLGSLGKQYQLFELRLGLDCLVGQNEFNLRTSGRFEHVSWFNHRQLGLFKPHQLLVLDFDFYVIFDDLLELCDG